MLQGFNTISPTSPTSTAHLASSAAEADRIIVERCLAGEHMAWSCLYDLCQAHLREAISRQLSKFGAQATELDELLALVWFQLVEDDACRLAAYSPERGRLIPFVCGLARNVTRNYLRSERRRRIREARFLRYSPSEHTPDQVALDIQTFCEVLTHREKDYFVRCFRGAEVAETSASNQRKLKSRVKRKFVKFFDCDGYIEEDE